MLTIKLQAEEHFDNDRQEFVTTDEAVLEFEHSLVSLSKWESEFEKPFLGPASKTMEETLAYLKFMVQNVEATDELISRLTNEHILQLNEYIESKRTATWFAEPDSKRPATEIITAEIIRYWMITMQIPIEYEKMHLNQLITMIKVISEKNKPQKKMSPGQLAKRNRELNAQRKAKLNTNG